MRHASRWLSIALGMALAGCGEQPPEPAAGALTGSVAAAATERPGTFATAESLRDFLCQLSTAGDRLDMLDLVYTELRVEKAVTIWWRSAMQARLDYAVALNDRFATDAGDVEPTDLGMGDYVPAMCAAELEQLSPVLVRATFTLPDGTDEQLILERRGTWKVNVSTLTGGAEVTDVWFFTEQFRYGAIVQYHRDVARQLQEGEFATADEARAHLEELLAGPPPRLGTVDP
jgi:hypothetical protein